MKAFKIISVLAILLVLTIGHSLFLNISSGAAFVFVEQMGASPGFIFDLMVKPYVVWIIFAWISFFINTGLIIIPLLKKIDPIDYVPPSIHHLLWVSVSFLWHATGMISPFFTKALVIK